MWLAYLVTKRIWKQLLRDRRTLGLAFMAPLMYIALFGVAFGGEINHVPIIVINQDTDAAVIFPPFLIPSIGKQMKTNLEESQKVDVINLTDDFDTAKRAVEEKRFICAVIIPENFTSNVASLSGENVSIQLYLDNSNPQVGVVVLAAFQQAFQDAIGEFRGNLGVEISYAYGEDLTTIEFFAPAMIIFGVFFLSFILIIMNLIGERKAGTLDLLLQCPYDKGQIIFGYLGAFSILSFFQTTVILIAASILFNIQLAFGLAELASLYIGAVVCGWTGLVLAIFLSSYARNEFQAIQFVPIVILPALLLSGIIIPLNQIPEVVRWVAYLIPTTYGVHLLRQISIEGLILTPWNVDLIVQLLFVVLFLFGSRLTLRET
ncbi:MAG: ABC transporter permease [Candidatus Thorarchaeota archaeon]